MAEMTTFHIRMPGFNMCIWLPIPALLMQTLGVVVIAQETESCYAGRPGFSIAQAWPLWAFGD